MVNLDAKQVQHLSVERTEHQFRRNLNGQFAQQFREKKKKKTNTDLNKLIATIHRASRLKPITENRKSTPVDSCRFLGLCKLRDKRKINYMLWCETDEGINNSAE